MNSIIKYLFLGLVLGSIGLAGCATVDRETASSEEEHKPMKQTSLMDRSGL
jgi:hypothetical protein